MRTHQTSISTQRGFVLIRRTTSPSTRASSIFVALQHIPSGDFFPQHPFYLFGKRSVRKVVRYRTAAAAAKPVPHFVESLPLPKTSPPPLTLSPPRFPSVPFHLPTRFRVCMYGVRFAETAAACVRPGDVQPAHAIEGRLGSCGHQQIHLLRKYAGPGTAPDTAPVIVVVSPGC